MFSVLQATLLAVFPALMIVAGLRDLTSYTIPNWISAILVLAFAPVALACGLPASQIGLHLVIGLGALVAAMGMFALGWIGGGDAKVFAAAALWLGWPGTAVFLMVTTLAGGALALGLLAIRSDWLRTHTPLTVPGWTHRLMRDGEAAPYGVAIAIGALAAWPSAALMATFHGIL